MKILIKTPRTEMAHQSLVNKMASFYEALGEELGFDKIAVDMELSRFATLSSRVEFGKGEIDFDLALPSDGAEEIKAKFLKYADTERYAATEAALVAIARQDMPLVSAEKAPELAETAPKN